MTDLDAAIEAEVLTPGAVAFITDLHDVVGGRRDDLLDARRRRHHEVRTRGLNFTAETREVREASWTVAAPPADLLDRRVEITGPVGRKTTINALNSGANAWLADFEDALTPTWANVVLGQRNLRDAIARTITADVDGRHYALSAGRRPTIIVRPRGWHLDERHLVVDGRPAVAALVDVGLYLAHNTAPLLTQGSGPYLYLPKLEGANEAELWDAVLSAAEDLLGLPRNTVRVTVLIETITAAFEMDEILFALRGRATGLNAGRWDYLFSIVKRLGHRRDALLPDRNSITMTAPMMRAYTDLLVATCHRRGAHAIGGMAAVVPSRHDPEATRRALDAVRKDKEREAADGFDGSWVAHPDLVSVCRSAFDAVLADHPNQVGRLRPHASVGARQLLDVGATSGERTRRGLVNNIEVALRYLEAWLRGVGAVAIDGLMEDAATAEIACAQVRQWVGSGAVLADGTTVRPLLVRQTLDDVEVQVAAEVGDRAFGTGRWRDARGLIERITLGAEPTEFFTSIAYDQLEDTTCAR